MMGIELFTHREHTMLAFTLVIISISWLQRGVNLLIY